MQALLSRAKSGQLAHAEGRRLQRQLRPIVRTVPTFGLASNISISPDSKDRSRSSGSCSVPFLFSQPS